jgi:hypothetical protein
MRLLEVIREAQQILRLVEGWRENTVQYTAFAIAVTGGLQCF